MKSINSDYFIVKVRLEKVTEDGLLKKVNETYVVDALTFGEAETRVTDEIQIYANGSFEILKIDRAQFHEVFLHDEMSDDLSFFKAKVAYITLDERTSKEKKTYVHYLIQDSSIEKAQKNLLEIIGKGIADYNLSSISETNVVELFLYDKPAQ